MLLLIAALLPGLYWERGPETAPAIRAAGIERLYVPAKQAEAWQATGLKVTGLDEAALGRFEKLKPPRVQMRMNVASATRQPWIDASGWLFERRPGGHYWYDLPAGAAPLAAAEAFAYGADAILRIDPGDLEALGRMLAFLRTVDGPAMPVIANICVAEDGSPELGEGLLMLARRNLPFRMTPKSGPGCAVFVRLGSPLCPREKARNPAAFATMVRSTLTDEKRPVRIFGSETVIVRLSGSGGKARLDLINYLGRKVTGMRVRVLGKYGRAKIRTPAGAVAGADVVSEAGAVELTVPELEVYAVAELE